MFYRGPRQWVKIRYQVICQLLMSVQLNHFNSSLLFQIQLFERENPDDQSKDTDKRIDSHWTE